jgi:hypothetical protein
MTTEVTTVVTTDVTTGVTGGGRMTGGGGMTCLTRPAAWNAPWVRGNLTHVQTRCAAYEGVMEPAGSSTSASKQVRSPV